MMTRLPMRAAALAALFVLCLLVTFPRADDGSLTPEMLKDLRSGFKMDPATRAMYNAITGGDVSALAVNRDILQQHNNVFSNKLKAKGITNQKSSGRCWLFAGLNVMRPAVIEKYKLDGFEFSQSYMAFYDKLEKANCFLEQMIELGKTDPMDREMEWLCKNSFTDGGWWEYVVALIDKHGVVPQQVMPETNSSENTRVMNLVIQRRMKVDALRLRELVKQGKSPEEIRAAKKAMMAEIYRMLVMNYGQPPAEFAWRYVDKDAKVSEMKTYTPQSFYKEFVGVDLNQYVDLCDDPTQQYGKHYRLRRVKDIQEYPEVNYANVPAKTLRELALKSLLDNEPVLFSADASADMDRTKGIMANEIFDYRSIYGVDLGLSKADRLLYREGFPNHAMVFIGVDVKDGKPVKWLVENSWGKEKGDGGLWTMYDSWFDEHVYSIIVKKAYVPNDILQILKQDSIELPPWHPMNALFR
jgi:bleomycin hydrolase